MNSHLYRIVFNHALGLCQVASELIRRPGSGASSVDGRRTAHVRPVSLGLWVAFGWIGITSMASAGQVVGDPNAPGNQRDSYIDPTTGLQIPTGGFLNAERNLLQSKGWIFNSTTGSYTLPKP